MISVQELKKINEKHFKKGTNSILFCKECNLKEQIYCSKCAQKQINKLKKF
ncbi:hypothetical protein KAI04_04340 [Candidatus Pacearchaeota archaeon]|nr:hypothetical protein [Candidatus Pacearchaeota archaeon]